MLIQLVGGHRDGELMAIPDRAPQVLQLPKPSTTLYTVESAVPPLEALTLQVLRFRLERRGTHIAAVFDGQLVDRDDPRALLGEPIFDFDLDVADGWRYVLA